MKIADIVQKLDTFAQRTSKKSAVDGERIAIEWTGSGAVLLHLDVTSSPKIKRFARIKFDSAMTEAEKRNAFSQFISPVSGKNRPKAVLCWAEGMTFRQLALPEMPHEDLVKAMDWELKKKYYFNPDENLLGYKEVMTLKGEESVEKIYGIFYSETKTALPRLDFAFGLGLEVLSLVPNSAAAARFVFVQRF